MVRLNRIYTKTGDDGSTGLSDGSRVDKDAARLEAIGAVDEANAVLGVAVRSAPDDIKTVLTRAQNDLFDLGADLSMPTDPKDYEPLRITADQVARLEAEIDRANERLEPLTSFILPGGSEAAAALHVARTVVRRAERQAVTLAKAEPVNPDAVKYLNRLSDLLFVQARLCNGDGRDDVLWTPGGER